MPAHAGELQEAVEEGIKLKWLTTIKEAETETITVEKMELDADGFPQPTGELEVMPADSVVLALGQDVDTRVLESVGDLQIDHRGVATRGLLVRHLVLPNRIADSAKVIDFLASSVSRSTYLNIMDQYHPAFHASGDPITRLLLASAGLSSTSSSTLVTSAMDFNWPS